MADMRCVHRISLFVFVASLVLRESCGARGETMEGQAWKLFQADAWLWPGGHQS